MSDKPAILGIDGKEVVKRVPKVRAVHPYGSKILVEVLNADEVMGTNLFVSDTTDSGDAPQAYILELGPQVDEESGLCVGQRIYWEGKGLAVNDPRGQESGRVIALLEIHNVRAVIEEEKCCGGVCEN